MDELPEYVTKSGVMGAEKKRTPQIYRQCWQMLLRELENGQYLWFRPSLLRRMAEIEKQARG